MQMDILSNTDIELESKPGNKSREQQRRAKQRAETAEPKKVQRRKIMTSIAVVETPQQPAIKGKGKRKKPKPKSKISAPIVVTDYMTTIEAAAYLKLSRQFLEGARYRGDGSGPAYMKLGKRSVRYRKTVLDAWMAAHDHSPDKPSLTK